MQSAPLPPSTPVLGFVTGMSRSGTRWLTECLNDHPEVVAFGETSFWGRRFVAPSLGGTRYSKADLELLRSRQIAGGRTTEPSKRLVGKKGISWQVITRFLNENVSPTPREVFDAIAGELAQAEGKTFAVEKTPHHINFIDRILRWYPEARFIVMLRDPYSFMLSYKHQGDRRPDEQRQAFQRMYHPFGCALVYRGYARSIARAMALHPDRCLRVRFEELESQPNEVLLKVQQFLGLSPAPLLRPAVNTSFPLGERPPLAPADLFWMNTIARSQLRALQIPPKPAPDALPDVVQSLTRLPLWALHVGQSMFEKQGWSAVGYLKRWLR